jgi:anti-sigma regulatory factor (Ser/Thr protein kinase)
MAKLIGTPGSETDLVGDVVTVSGRHRLPSETVDELMDVLVDEPRVVVCDLTELAPVGGVERVFLPVGHYLAHWTGTVVVVCAPDPAVRAEVADSACAASLLVHDSREAGLGEARALAPDVRRAGTHLPPLPTASREARVFATRTLLDWQMPQVIRPVSLVVSELVTNSVVHARTALDLTLSRVGTRVRVAVRDHGGGDPRARPPQDPAETLTGRGLQLVHAFTRGWGVVPASAGGKTVWAVLDRVH